MLVIMRGLAVEGGGTSLQMDFIQVASELHVAPGASSERFSEERLQKSFFRFHYCIRLHMNVKRNPLKPRQPSLRRLRNPAPLLTPADISLKNCSFANLIDASLQSKQPHKDFLEKSKQILEMHFSRKDSQMQCGNGCQKRARYFIKSIDGRIYFCLSCAKNLNKMDFQIIPLEEPRASVSRSVLSERTKERVERCQQHVKDNLIEAMNTQKQHQSMLSQCLQQLQSIFCKLVNNLKQWRNEMYETVQKTFGKSLEKSSKRVQELLILQDQLTDLQAEPAQIENRLALIANKLVEPFNMEVGKLQLVKLKTALKQRLIRAQQVTKLIDRQQRKTVRVERILKDLQSDGQNPLDWQV